MNEDKQIEKMLKSICMDCRYFTRCNDDTMCGGEKLSKVLRERCSTWKIGEAIYNAGYRKQRKGQWISVVGDVIFKCSLCEAEISTSWDYENEDMFSYCPVCGASMKGGEQK